MDVRFQVKSVSSDTRLCGVANDYQPKKKCHLQKIKPKDPVEDENNCHGPNFMSTESRKHFVEKPLNGPQGECVVQNTKQRESISITGLNC